MIKTITKLAIVLMVFIQCSSSAMNTGSRSKYDPYMIFAEEISELNYNNAYDLISFVRPTWLRGSDFNSISYGSTSYPIVYVNGTRYGDMSSLRSILLNNIVLIEFLRPNDAIAKYGSSHSGGVISIDLSR